MERLCVYPGVRFARFFGLKTRKRTPRLHAVGLNFTGLVSRPGLGRPCVDVPGVAETIWTEKSA